MEEQQKNRKWRVECMAARIKLNLNSGRHLTNDEISEGYATRYEEIQEARERAGI